MPLTWELTTRGEISPEYWIGLHRKFRIKITESGVIQLLAANKIQYAIGETTDGKFALLTGEWVLCEPIYFNTLDAAKAAAELLVNTHGH